MGTTPGYESLPDPERGRARKVRYARTYTGVGKTSKTADMVNHPPHYQAVDRNGNKHETVDCCEAHQLNSAEAQAVQYIMRAKKKGNYLQDMYKARWWLNRAIENEEIRSKQS